MGTKRKKEQKFTREMQIKLMAVFAFVLLLLVALNLVIAHINVTNGDKYAKQVLSQQTYDSRTIPFRRGEIQDRNGNVLAKSEKVYNVWKTMWNRRLQQFRKCLIWIQLR